MRSRRKLLECSGYSDRVDEFDELMRLLDGELRLITPTDPEGSQRPSEDTDDSCYQLAHDYLVPSFARLADVQAKRNTTRPRPTSPGRTCCVVERQARKTTLADPFGVDTACRFHESIWADRGTAKDDVRSHPTSFASSRSVGLCACGRRLGREWSIPDAWKLPR